ncbi:MAG TPA: SCO family protein [Candidatus Acidoferrales bacterium]|nr:SCO family protein [Candidatus Acidoferrales bacterium]
MSKVARLRWSGQARIRKGLTWAAFTLIFLAYPANTLAQFSDPDQSIGVRPELLKSVGVDERLNHSIPLDLRFRDEHGKTVDFSHYFRGKPVILTLVYYNCPMLCTQVLNGLDRSLEQIPLSIGKDFDVVTVSIDPTEQPSLAEAKQAVYLGMYNRPSAWQGWHFLTGEDPQIRQLAGAVGFRYAYDPESKQYAHASVIMLLTPDGRLSRYFYGVSYPARDLRLGLVDASGGKIGSPVDQVLLFCYHYDPHAGKYGLLISRVLQLAGLATILIGGVLLILAFRGERYSASFSRIVTKL